MGMLTLLWSVKSGDRLLMLQKAILWIDHVLTIPGAMSTVVTGVPVALVVISVFKPWKRKR